MLASRLDTGEADLARPALLRAVTRLRKILEHADDSSGVIGAAGQRAARLYARSCREGHPDRIALARWLVRFRVESPGWPGLTLADFVAAFDERAMAQYPTDVAAADEQHRHHGSRFEVDRMLLELADHDGDVDRAIEVLNDRRLPLLNGRPSTPLKHSIGGGWDYTLTTRRSRHVRRTCRPPVPGPAGAGQQRRPDDRSGVGAVRHHRFDHPAPGAEGTRRPTPGGALREEQDNNGRRGQMFTSRYRNVTSPHREARWGRHRVGWLFA
jgi:hypothetical protein